MTKKQTTKRSTRHDTGDDVEGNVDKIRDILFGNQMRDYESRLAAMEKRLAQSIEQSARDLERRIDRLDKYARREVDKLTEQIKAERRDRTAEGKKGTSEFSDFAEQVEAWFAEVDDQLAGEMKTLRTTLHEQGKELAAQIREAHAELQVALQKEATELADVKLAREDLAALLTEVAVRLKKDFKLPKT